MYELPDMGFRLLKVIRAGSFTGDTQPPSSRYQVECVSQAAQ